MNEAKNDLQIPLCFFNGIVGQLNTQTKWLILVHFLWHFYSVNCFLNRRMATCANHEDFDTWDFSRTQKPKYMSSFNYQSNTSTNIIKIMKDKQTEVIMKDYDAHNNPSQGTSTKKIRHWRHISPIP